MEVKGVCPLGCECERVVDQHIERCNWYVEMEGNNPQNGEKTRKSQCAMQWIPLLQIESNGISINTRESVQSLRNETVGNQNKAIEVMKNVQVLSNS